MGPTRQPLSGAEINLILVSRYALPRTHALPRYGTDSVIIPDTILHASFLLNDNLIGKDPRITTGAGMPAWKLAKRSRSHPYVSNSPGSDRAREILHY